jgi:ferric-dicitrate binding protein FerR (iron transport regulator)
MSKINKILNLYLLHNYTESVQKEFADWLDSPQDREQKEDSLFQEWESISVRPGKMDTRSSYEAVVSRIERKESMVRRANLASLFLRVAAVIVVCVAVVAAVKILVERTPNVVWNEVSTQRGENRIVELADGSVIYLAPGSRLIYPNKFTDNVRRVYLSGEAYADIAKDDMHRFIVSAEQVDVIVHGTQFNIRSYESNSEVEVMLLEGSIDMQTKNQKQNRVVRMRPGDLFKLDKMSGRLSCETISADIFDDDPRARNLTFINSRLGDIAVQLERMFNVRIVIDNSSLADERYYSAFVNNESLDRILSTLEHNGNFDYQWRGGEIHLYKK